MTSSLLSSGVEVSVWDAGATTLGIIAFVDEGRGRESTRYKFSEALKKK